MYGRIGIIKTPTGIPASDSSFIAANRREGDGAKGSTSAARRSSTVVIVNATVTRF